MSDSDIKNEKKLKSLILSFDDGPTPVSALKQILQILENKKITAEFYVRGDHVKACSKENVNIIITKGHLIQNHSWSHPKYLYTWEESKIRKQITDTQEIIYKYTKKYATKFRPPYGHGGFEDNPKPPYKLNDKLKNIVESLSLKMQVWDFDSEDSKKPGESIDIGDQRSVLKSRIGITKESYSSIKYSLKWKRNREKNELYVLLHVLDETANDLTLFINTMKEWGHRFAIPKQ